MPSKSYPPDVIAQTQAATEAWKNIDPAFKVGSLELTAVCAELDQARQVQARLDSLESQITDLRNKRDAHGTVLWDMLKRLRLGVKAIYGDDSSEYEMIGGTRLSERKPVARKKAAA